MLVVDNQEFPCLFSHSKREEWGVAVLSGHSEGRRSYLFEDGEERTLGTAGVDLLRKVERPNQEQQATWAHLLSLLAKRRGRREPHEIAVAAAVERQLTRFQQKYAQGFTGKSWTAEKNGARARNAREALVPQVQARLSPKRVADMITKQNISQVWLEAAELLRESGLVVGAFPEPEAHGQRQLAQAIVDLLYGHESYERRFDRWVSACSAVMGDAPSWQTATALPALLSPVEHVYVDPTSFRKQLGVLGRPSAMGGRPSGSAYLRCLAAAQSLANLLAARGAIARDLLDVHDFVRITAVSSKAEAAE
ncbi:MAG: hypothetical protein EOO73_19385 [Myxococcales bacterium]|nr:MAG: hypothetical protein EOO73_19385 [Myxococcales bacterium]